MTTSPIAPRISYEPCFTCGCVMGDLQAKLFDLQVKCEKLELMNKRLLGFERLYVQERDKSEQSRQQSMNLGGE